MARDVHGPGSIFLLASPRTQPHLMSERLEATEPDLEVVVPVRNEEANIPLLAAEVARAARAAGVRHSILFVDDGSQDNSANLIRQLATEGAPVRGLRLSRNFGH